VRSSTNCGRLSGLWKLSKVRSNGSDQCGSFTFQGVERTAKASANAGNLIAPKWCASSVISWLTHR